jgi:hypothetical protein
MGTFEKYTYSVASITRKITTVYFKKWYHSSPNLLGKKLMHTLKNTPFFVDSFIRQIY